MIGHGNLVEAKAMLKKAGNIMAKSQRMVFHFKRFFFSEFFISYVVALLILRYLRFLLLKSGSGNFAFFCVP